MSALLKRPNPGIAYLGPEGSFAHMVAQKRFPDLASRNGLKPFRSVPEVFGYVEEHEMALGIVPIENSSGGMILPTVDGIIEHAIHEACSLFIQEELSINVKLSLLGKKGRKIETIYSHFAPLSHCEAHIAKHYPDAKTVACTSTSVSAEKALEDPNGAAIAPAASAELFGMDILEAHLREDVQNVTQFLLIGRNKHESLTGGKTSLVVALPNHAGSLVDFLTPWKNAGINLTRIESRPIIGQPNTYRFLVEIIGTSKDPSVYTAMAQAKALSQQFYDVGSYPVVPRYES
jgi:prephenate dehydratase